jgi:hypothetical protein
MNYKQMLHAADCYTNFTPNHTFSLQQEVTPVLMPVICTSHRAGAAQPSPCPHPRRASHAPRAPRAPKALTSPAVPTTCLRSGERARARATPHGLRHPTEPAHGHLDRPRPRCATNIQVRRCVVSVAESITRRRDEHVLTIHCWPSQASLGLHALGARLRHMLPCSSTHTWKPW